MGRVSKELHINKLAKFSLAAAASLRDKLTQLGLCSLGTFTMYLAMPRLLLSPFYLAHLSPIYASFYCQSDAGGQMTTSYGGRT